MANSVIDFQQMGSDTGEKFEYNGVQYDLEDYTSFDFNKMQEFVKTCTEDFFSWYQAADGDKIEKISHDVYGTTKYWDILILLNDRNPLFDMSYSFDARSEIVEEKLNYYNDNVKSLNNTRYQELFDEFMHELDVKNELLRAVKIVEPTKITEFIRKGYEMGCFK